MNNFIARLIDIQLGEIAGHVLSVAYRLILLNLHITIRRVPKALIVIHRKSLCEGRGLQVANPNPKSHRLLTVL